MDEDLGDDLDELMSNIDGAEAMSIFFPTLRKAVVIDTRQSEDEGPLIRIMPMAASPQERMRSIRRLRPNFPRLRNLTLIPWFRYVDSLVKLGIWDRLIERFRDIGNEEAVASCGTVLEELRRLEQAELVAVVLGENYHTIWSARR